MTFLRATKRFPVARSLCREAGGLLIAACLTSACGPAGLPPDDAVASSQDRGLAARKTPRPSFYEDDPTYVSTVPDDGFWTLATPASQHLDAAVLEDAARAQERIPSALSLLVIRNDKLVFERYFHGSQANFSNNIHSASKSILSSLVGIALDRGLIDSVDQTVGELLPAYYMKDDATASITLRDLLTMSSGLEWTEDQTEYSIEKADNWVQAILDLPVTSTPGTQFNYSTGNAHLIAAILTRAAGQPLPAFATAALFDPLGLHFEHWGKDPQGIASGGYNFYVTPRTLARFALMVFGGGQLGGKQLVPASWIASSLKPEEPAHTGYHYGYCYWLPRIAGHAVAKMWGYGGQFAYLIPDANLIVVITNDTAHSYPEPDGDAFVAKYILPAILK